MNPEFAGVLAAALESDAPYSKAKTLLVHESNPWGWKKNTNLLHLTKNRLRQDENTILYEWGQYDENAVPLARQ